MATNWLKDCFCFADQKQLNNHNQLYFIYRFASINFDYNSIYCIFEFSLPLPRAFTFVVAVKQTPSPCFFSTAVKTYAMLSCLSKADQHRSACIMRCQPKTSNNRHMLN